MTSKAQATQEKNKSDIIKMKSFCASKDIIKKVKKLTEWEKIFVNQIPDKGLVFRIF